MKASGTMEFTRESKADRAVEELSPDELLGDLAREFEVMSGHCPDDLLDLRATRKDAGDAAAELTTTAKGCLVVNTPCLVYSVQACYYPPVGYCYMV